MFLLTVLGLSACSDADPVAVDTEFPDLDIRASVDDLAVLDGLIPPDSVLVYSSQTDTTDDGQ